MKMVSPGSIAFDIDGVVADTMSLFLEIARSEYDINRIGYEDITSYNLDECLDMDVKVIKEIVAKLTDGLHSQPLRPINGATETLARIGLSFGRLSFVTARPYLGPMRDWIYEMLPLLEHESIDIIATGSFDDKADVLLKMGKSFFVEDRLETCFSLEEAGIEPILFEQPWNRHKNSFTLVNSWKELEGLIDFS